MSADTRTYWKAPSGRIHGMLHCSGNGRPRDTKRVKLTREQFDAANLCRCARWRVA
jgi:hypothetical protein